MRTLHLLWFSLLAVLVLFSSACDDARDPGAGIWVGPAPRLPASAGSNEADAGADGSDGVMITGRLETDDGLAIIGRPITAVDARGEHREILSDEGGGFNVPDIVPPYDLVVGGSPSGSVQTPTIFLGLERSDPFIELFERDGPTMRPPAQKLRFGVKPPLCTASSCAITVVSGSATGGGASSIAYRDETLVPFEIDHEWSGAMVGAKEIIELHVLVTDASRTAFSYSRREGIRAEAGDLTELGIFEPASVPASAPFVVSAIARGPAAAWSPSIATWLDLPGGAALSFTYGTERDELLRIPILHGATLRANAWMQHPAVPDRPQFHGAAQAWSGSLPISPDGGVLSLDLPSAPVPMRPEMDGQLSARGLGFAWSNPLSAPVPLMEVTVVRIDTGTLRYRVWTAGDEIPFAKLDTLGLKPLTPGDHVIGFTSSPADTLDEIVHPDPAVRHGRRDPRRRGAATYQRFRFQVTP